jgi:hypothetical protein
MRQSLTRTLNRTFFYSSPSSNAPHLSSLYSWLFHPFIRYNPALFNFAQPRSSSKFTRSALTSLQVKMCAPTTLDDAYYGDYERMILPMEDYLFNPEQDLLEDPYIRLPFLRPGQEALALARQLEIDRLSTVLTRLRQLQAQLHAQRDELAQLLADIEEFRNEPEVATEDIDELPADDPDRQDIVPDEQEQPNTADDAPEASASSLKRKPSDTKDKTGKKHKQGDESEGA